MTKACVSCLPKFARSVPGSGVLWACGGMPVRLPTLASILASTWREAKEEEVAQVVAAEVQRRWEEVMEVVMEVVLEVAHRRLARAQARVVEARDDRREDHAALERSCAHHRRAAPAAVSVTVVSGRARGIDRQTVLNLRCLAGGIPMKECTHRARSLGQDR